MKILVVEDEIRVASLIRKGLEEFGYETDLALDAAAAQFLRMADLEMNLTTKTVRRGNRKVDLTAREYALLEYFLRNPNRALSRLEIASHVWDVSFDTGTNVVDVYINYLRRKIDKDFSPKLIHTLTGTGYIMKVDEETP